MKMTFTEQLKIILNRENKSVEELAADLGTTKQNLYQQFKRNNFKENDMKKICDVLGYEISINIEKI
jgi:DNA-binding Xre family transcriptional regulator